MDRLIRRQRRPRRGSPPRRTRRRRTGTCRTKGLERQRYLLLRAPPLPRGQGGALQKRLRPRVRERTSARSGAKGSRTPGYSRARRAAPLRLKSQIRGEGGGTHTVSVRAGNPGKSPPLLCPIQPPPPRRQQDGKPLGLPKREGTEGSQLVARDSTDGGGPALSATFTSGGTTTVVDMAKTAQRWGTPAAERGATQLVHGAS